MHDRQTSKARQVRLGAALALAVGAAALAARGCDSGSVPGDEARGYLLDSETVVASVAPEGDAASGGTGATDVHGVTGIPSGTNGLPGDGMRASGLRQAPLRIDLDRTVAFAAAFLPWPRAYAGAEWWSGGAPGQGIDVIHIVLVFDTKADAAQLDTGAIALLAQHFGLSDETLELPGADAARILTGPDGLRAVGLRVGPVVHLVGAWGLAPAAADGAQAAEWEGTSVPFPEARRPGIGDPQRTIMRLVTAAMQQTSTRLATSTAQHAASRTPAGASPGDGR